MTSAERQVRKEQLRLYVFGGMLATFAISWAIGSFYLVGTIDDQRTTCEAGNRARVSEMADRQSELDQRDALILNARGRIADDPSAEEPRAALQRAIRLRDEEQAQINRLVASVATPVAPRSVVRNCADAYPKPPPWGWFD